MNIICYMPTINNIEQLFKFESNYTYCIIKFIMHFKTKIFTNRFDNVNIKK